jgi:NAD(P)-dependent dehydrogenase (short-subunit alcohol dehydrogenase family)
MNGNDTLSPFRSDLLAGRRVLVTGGGTGLGKATALRMAALGARIVICGRRDEVLQGTATEIAAATGTEVVPIRCDIRDSGAVAAMMDQIWQTGPLDVLVNNAAANFLARTETLSARAFDAITSIALNGNAYCSLAVGSRWIAEKRRGVILNVLTAGAAGGRAFTVPLTMAKAAMLAMTKSLAVEWGPKGIRSIAVAPGLFPTPGAWQQLYPGDRDKQNGVVGSIPVGRFGEHHEFADLCAFLVSDAASYINGDMITVDGGRALKGMDVDDLMSWSEERWESTKKGRQR